MTSINIYIYIYIYIFIEKDILLQSPTTVQPVLLRESRNICDRDDLVVVGWTFWTGDEREPFIW